MTNASTPARVAVRATASWIRATGALAALAVGLAAPAAHAGDHTLHLAVHGSLDSGKLAHAIASELGVEVAVVEGTCDLPCLDVTVDGDNVATVVFVPRSGQLRQRAVKLGTNTRQWPVVITLLAGNVVRDEARDVLAGLPPPGLAIPPPPEAAPPDVPPAPGDVPPPPGSWDAGPAGPLLLGQPAPDPSAAIMPPPPPAGPALAEQPQPAPVREHRFFAFGLVPGLSTDFTRVGSVRHFLAIHALVGVSGGSSGLSVSGLVDVQRGLTAGVQLAGLVATSRQLAGTQVAGVAAVAGDIDGVQIAGTAAIADRVDGFQGAGVAAYSRSDAGTQVAGVASIVRGRVGTQAAGVSTNAVDAGLQVAGVANNAHGQVGVQIAGVVNVARHLKGLQIGTINIARKVEGVQVGVLNVGSADGFSLGLINIVPGGRYDLEATYDSDQIGTLLFRHGGRRWHNVYGIAGQSVDEDGPSDDVWMYGFGFGPTLRFNDTVVDIEAIGWQVNHGPRHQDEVSILAQARLSVAHHWGRFAIVAGGALNAYITSDQQSPLVSERRTSTQMEDGVTVTTWPSAFVGLRM